MSAGVYRFQVLGPFAVPVASRRWRGLRQIDFPLACEAVFEQAQLACRERYDVGTAIGLYVFGLSPPGSSRTRPYYVGQACRQSLRKRVFQPIDKPDLYNDILNWYERAAPFVYLLPLLTPAGRLAAKGSNARRIDLAEYTLIGTALRANPDLWNVKHRVGMESFAIDGLPGSSQRTTSTISGYKAMLSREPAKKVARQTDGKLPSPEFRIEAENAANVSAVIDDVALQAALDAES